jgi:predicted amidophosphoribosyltransferase
MVQDGGTARQVALLIIEDYETCPICAAVYEGVEYCPHCGERLRKDGGAQ